MVKFPHEEESISNVLVGGTRVPVDDSVADLSNLVHEQHDTLLKHLCGIREVSNITESKDRHEFDTWEHGIDITTLGHILSDNLRASFTESEGEKRTNLTECLLKHCSLHGFIPTLIILLLDLFFDLISHLHLGSIILCQLLK